MHLHDLTMPLDWETMPDEVFPTSTHFLLAPRTHPAKGMTLGNETGTCLLLPSQFTEFRRGDRIHTVDLQRLMLREAAVVSIDTADGPDLDVDVVQRAFAAAPIGDGDAVLVRTGWGDDVGRFTGTGRYVLDSPYFTTAAAEFVGETLRARGSDLLVVDTAWLGRPAAHLVPQWAGLMPRPAPWPSDEARVYLRSYTTERVMEDWAADYALAAAGVMVLKKVVNCGALTGDRVKLVVAPLHLVRAIGATCRVVAIEEEGAVQP